jgi:hypothetical protein
MQIIYLCILSLLANMHQILSQSLCNIHVAETLLAAFQGSDIIYKKGVINEKWQLNSKNPHTVPLNRDLDYLYSLEMHVAELQNTHQSIVNII